MPTKMAEVTSVIVDPTRKAFMASVLSITSLQQLLLSKPKT
jgi:hypothetical protein